MFKIPEIQLQKQPTTDKLSDSHKMKTYNTIRIKIAKTYRGNIAICRGNISAININIYTIINN